MSINVDVSKMSLASVPEKMLDFAMEVLLDQAHVMVGIAQVNAHVDTGAYRDSIRVERGGEGEAWRQVKVRAGGYIVNPKTGKLVDYAGILEFKYHNLADAWEEVKPTILIMLKEGVVTREGWTQ